MKTMLELICTEFEQWGYTLRKEMEGVLLYASNVGYDYWVICSNIDIITIQKRLFDQIKEFSGELDFIEKNITLLLLIDNDGDYRDLDTIKVENNKSYFKKFVLRYTSDSVTNLIKLLEDKGVGSIANLLLSEQCFNSIKNGSRPMSEVLLLYSIAHKLPFIPIISETKERSVVDLHFSSPELYELFEWVEKAPTEEHEIINYLNQLTINE